MSLTINTGLTGRIIGKGGANIKNIRSSCGRVRIDFIDNPDGTTTCLRITGEDWKVKRATKMIENLLQSIAVVERIIPLVDLTVSELIEIARRHRVRVYKEKTRIVITGNDKSNRLCECAIQKKVRSKQQSQRRTQPKQKKPISNGFNCLHDEMDDIEQHERAYPSLVKPGRQKASNTIWKGRGSNTSTLFEPKEKQPEEPKTKKKVEEEPKKVEPKKVEPKPKKVKSKPKKDKKIKIDFTTGEIVTNKKELNSFDHFVKQQVQKQKMDKDRENRMKTKNGRDWSALGRTTNRFNLTAQTKPSKPKPPSIKVVKPVVVEEVEEEWTDDEDETQQDETQPEAFSGMHVSVLYDPFGDEAPEQWDE